jgi:hypothetical protein
MSLQSRIDRLFNLLPAPRPKPSIRDPDDAELDRWAEEWVATTDRPPSAELDGWAKQRLKRKAYRARIKTSPCGELS